MPYVSPPTRVENALNRLSNQMNLISHVCSSILPHHDVDENWHLSDPKKVEMVTISFQNLAQFIKNEIEPNHDMASPVREILAISEILDKITHTVSVLAKSLYK